MPHLLAEISNQDKIVALVAALVVLAIAAIGWRDVSRFGFRRVRAIAGVSFREAIRRRVLWITPLAIIGVVAVTQLTRPFDEQDAIRQTVRYCLFASGIIVVVSAILLASTNLPKEIESRVIFTIVTKPTTRLEIVLGKVIGFAMVCGAMLLIMGAFTFTYLHIRAWSMLRHVNSELAAMKSQDAASAEQSRVRRPRDERHIADDRPAADPNAVAENLNRRVRRQTLERYAQGGLLGTKAIELPADLQVYSRDPGPGDAIRWISGNQQIYFIAPLVLSDEDWEKVQAAVAQRNLPYLVVRVVVDPQKHPSAEELRDLESGSTSYPVEEVEGPTLKESRPVYRPQIAVTVHSRKTGAYVAKDLFQGRSNTGKAQSPVPVMGQPRPGMVREFRIPLAVQQADKSWSMAPLAELLAGGPLNVEVSGFTPTYDYGAGPVPVSLTVPRDGNNFADPLVRFDSSTTHWVDPADEATHDESKRGVRFLSRQGRTGMQVAGRPENEGEGTVAIYRFTGVDDIQPQNGQVVLQTKLGVDRAGDLDPARNITTSTAEITVRNRRTGVLSAPVHFEPQTGRLIDVSVPAEAVAGGDFDVLVRGRTPGQLLSVRGLTASLPSITLVQAEQSFVVNLVKSLLVLWLLSILVVTIAVFCSTFLSWPIAVVLTLLLLLGRWGVETLGDSLAPGGSRSIMQDLFRTRDPSKNKAATDTMEALSAVLRNVGPVLPDVSRFPAFEDIDRGVSMPLPKLRDALLQLLLYGVPLVMLTYLVLRNKEVAP